MKNFLSMTLLQKPLRVYADRGLRLPAGLMVRYASLLTSRTSLKSVFIHGRFLSILLAVTMLLSFSVEGQLIPHKPPKKGKPQKEVPKKKAPKKEIPTKENDNKSKEIKEKD
jgi:hypothetical protein